MIKKKISTKSDVLNKINEMKEKENKKKKNRFQKRSNEVLQQPVTNFQFTVLERLNSNSFFVHLETETNYSWSFAPD
jgi:hypothetical protein